MLVGDVFLYSHDFAARLWTLHSNRETVYRGQSCGIGNHSPRFAHGLRSLHTHIRHEQCRFHRCSAQCRRATTQVHCERPCLAEQVLVRCYVSLLPSTRHFLASRAQSLTTLSSAVNRLWTLKFCILEFLKRLTDLTWQRSHHTALKMIRWTLVVTFVGVSISDLAECHPFSHYWQVLPDPGGRCRQAYAQLVTMASCNILTDLLLVIFPIPIILTSKMTARRKIQLLLLFSLSLSVVAVTIFRVPRIIQEHGSQQYRSLLASVELLFATAAANALVLGSFVRDRGVKKQKFRRPSAAESFDRASNTRRPTLHHHWGSDEDLVRGVGLGVDTDLRSQLDSPDVEHFASSPRATIGLNPDFNWQNSKRRSQQTEHSDDSSLARDPLSKPDPKGSKKGISFLDVGGSLDESVAGSSSSYRRGSHNSCTMEPNSPTYAAAPPPAVPARTSGVRRGSTALLQDLGGLLGPLNTKASRTRPRGGTELQPIPQSREVQATKSHIKTSPELRDPGGLLK